MWNYEKKLQYPVNIRKKDVKMAKYLITQFGGPDGELSASMRYLTQRYTMPTGKTKGLL
ncbi:manganese catalase family protein, partial [Akkermansia sp. GGCC_0220]|nr:manganese catalase family protein [Akkermansia sp. GGCC_0220]